MFNRITPNKADKITFEDSLVRVRRKYLTDIFLDRLIVAWAVLAVVVVGFFGIRPLWIQISQKRATISEMKEINERLETNFIVLDTLGQDLLLAGENLKYIYEYMPAQPDIHNYLVEFVNGTSSVGYNLTRYTPYVNLDETSNLGKVEITAKLKGIGDLVDLAKSMEDLKRVTSIKQIKYTEAKTSTDALLEVKVEIYYLKEL